MRVRYVTLTWDGQPREFEQTKLDIAWLMWSEMVGENRSDKSFKTLLAVAYKLNNHPEFTSSEARRYAIAAIRCGYNPATTPTSSIRDT